MLTQREFKLLGNIERQSYLENNFIRRSNRVVVKRSVYGHGINDSKYLTQPIVMGCKLMCPAYDSWKSMLFRSCSEKYKKRNPTYKEVSVNDSWKTFSNYLSWWKINQVDGWHLDKDLLTNNKEYSSECCLFIPQWLNKFTLDSKGRRGEFPLGVYYRPEYGKFTAACSNPITGKPEHVGVFSSPYDAHEAWMTKKLEFALMLKQDMDKIDTRIYTRVCDIIQGEH